MNDLVYFHCIGKAQKIAERVYKALVALRPEYKLAEAFKRYPNVELPTNIQPWLHGLDTDMKPQLAREKARFWVVFSDQPTSQAEVEQQMAALSPQPEKRPPVYLILNAPAEIHDFATVTFFKGPTETAQCIYGYWLFCVGKLLAELKLAPSIRFEPMDAFKYSTPRGFGSPGEVVGLFVDTPCSFYQWGYLPTWTTIKEPHEEVRISLGRIKKDSSPDWEAQGEQPIAADWYDFKAAHQCHLEILNQRYGEAERIFAKLLKPPYQWNIPWLLKGLIHLHQGIAEEAHLLKARFFFQIALCHTPYFFPAAFYSMLSLYKHDPEAALNELETLRTDCNFWWSARSGYLEIIKEDHFLKEMCSADDYQQIQDCLDHIKSARFVLNAPAQNKAPLPITLGGLFIDGFRGINLRLERLPHQAPWIFLTGENGEGKTALLQAIARAFYGSDKDDLCHAYFATTDKEELGVCVGVSGEMSYRVAGRLIGYGAYRLVKEGDKDNPVGSLLNSSSLLDIEVELRNYKLRLSSSELKKEDKKIIQNNIHQLCAVLAKIMPGIDTVEIDGDKVYYCTDGAKKVRNELSSGKQAINALVGDLVCRLLHNKDDSLFAEKERSLSLKDARGVVLIDELEVHLHPKWQEKLPKLLSSIFPKIQFIASTHSPIPILGAPPNSLVWRVEQENGEMKLHPFDDDFKDYNPNSLLTSPIFDYPSRGRVQKYVPEEYWQVLEEKELDEYLRRAEALSARLESLDGISSIDGLE